MTERRKTIMNDGTFNLPLIVVFLLFPAVVVTFISVSSFFLDTDFTNSIWPVYTFTSIILQIPVAFILFLALLAISILLARAGSTKYRSHRIAIVLLLILLIYPPCYIVSAFSLFYDFMTF